MSDKTLPELVTSKRPDDVRGDRWTVTGAHGRITYRELGGAVMVVAADGDTDHAVGNWPARCTAAAKASDEAVYAVLAELYEANFGGAQAAQEPVSEPTNPDRVCRNCGATSGLRLVLINPLSITYREWECAAGCTGGTQ